tara:strand:- start:7358 stop:7594 length:237 start_codon:yes stop_codon:yes gene_type:complete
MYSLSIHSVIKIEFQVTKLFNNFSSRNLMITTKDYEGNIVVHKIPLYAERCKNLFPVIDTDVSPHYEEDKDDTTETAA